MKPENTNPPLLLEDNAPVRCVFMVRTDPPRCWEECEQHATELLTEDQLMATLLWFDAHPKAIISVRLTGVPAKAYLCDSHFVQVRELW